MCRFHSSGACPTNDTRTKSETRTKSDALRLNTYPTDHNEISHTPRRCNGRDVCKTAPRSAEHTPNQSTPNPDRNPNPIQIPSLGQAPGQHWVSPATSPTVHGAQTTQVSTFRVQRPNSNIGGQWKSNTEDEIHMAKIQIARTPHNGDIAAEGSELKYWGLNKILYILNASPLIVIFSNRICSTESLHGSLFLCQHWFR